ncbi:hypothetical protein ACO1O0_004976 [Amphichorda felina]
MAAQVQAQPQAGDWPPGYVPGQGFAQPPEEPSFQPSEPPANGLSEPAVPLDRLQHRPQWIDCPSCHARSQTQVQGRSQGKQRFMNVFWWPLPGRKHWWETTHWFCKSCHTEIASQKNGKDIQILVNA